MLFWSWISSTCRQPTLESNGHRLRLRQRDSRRRPGSLTRSSTSTRHGRCSGSRASTDSTRRGPAKPRRNDSTPSETSAGAAGFAFFRQTDPKTQLSVQTVACIHLDFFVHATVLISLSNGVIRSPSTALSPPSKCRCGLACLVFNILPSGI